MGRLTIAGLSVKARPKISEEDPLGLPRRRGMKGRAEAVDRGLMTGNGYHGGVSNCERHVVLRGLPGRVQIAAVRYALRRYNLDETKGGNPSLAQIPMCVISCILFIHAPDAVLLI